MKEQIILRTFRKEDTSLSWQWRNQKAVQDHFSGHPYDVTKEQEEEWYEKVVLTDEKLQVYAIEVIADKKLVGMTFLKNINKINRKAEFAILIDQEHAGKGFGKEACSKTLSKAFNELGLHRVFLHVRVDNPAAIRIYESCGFKKEGELRDDVFKNGSFRNQYFMGILAREFKSV
jgi:diamine N-acetyltransferase